MAYSKLATVVFHLTVVITLFAAEAAHPPQFSCNERNLLTKRFGFCQTNISIHDRAKDLVSRLTLDEKISQLVHNAPAITRLDIPAFNWWSEALHGLAKGLLVNGTITSATNFPQVILTAASFDETLWYHIGQVIGREARGMYNEGQATGMTFWAPNINIFRDPRWGRGQETPGEDPTVAGKYAVSFVRGMQGDRSNHLQVSACCKHFTAYDLENWNGTDRYNFNAIVTKQDMADTFQPPFKACVQKAQASSVMCAYNSVNGIPNCANKELLTKTLRLEWGFRGYIASDCNAVHRIFDAHNYTKSPEEAVADALKAGMDLECGSLLLNYTKPALVKKYLKMSVLDRALHNLFETRMRLGLFNGNPKNMIYGRYGSKDVCSGEHQNLSLEAARKGIVLLKNSGKLLPLSKTKVRYLGVIGPGANNSEILLGNYHGVPCRGDTILQALQSYVKETKFQMGCNNTNCTYVMARDALELVMESDQIILVMGLDQGQESECLDRRDLMLPGHQQSLIEQVSSAAKSLVILVLLSGSPVDVTFAKHNPKIGSVLWAGYPGEAGGIALSEIIFGDYNPGGRLPMTWYPNNYTRIAMTDMRMRANIEEGYPGRTYRFYEGPKVFDFGYGLSYSDYSYEFRLVTKKTVKLSVKGEVSPADYIPVDSITPEVCHKAKFFAFVSVSNPGEMDGTHPVLLFDNPIQSQGGSPLRQLIGFKSVSLEAGETSEIRFRVEPCKHYSYANKDGMNVIEKGRRLLQVGNAGHLMDVI